MAKDEGGDLSAEVELTADAAQIKLLGEQISGFLQDGLTAAAPAMAKAFAKTLSKELAKGLKGIKGPLESLDTGQEAFARRTQEGIKILQDEIKQLDIRAAAVKKTLKGTGTDPEIFAGFNQAIKIAQSNLRELQRISAEGGSDESFDRIDKAAQRSISLGQKEVAQAQSTIKARVQAEKQAANAIAAEKQQAATKALTDSRQAHGKFIVEEQRTTTLLAIEARKAAAEQLQIQRQAAVQANAVQRAATQQAGIEARKLSALEVAEVRASVQAQSQAQRQADALRRTQARESSNLRINSERAALQENLIETRAANQRLLQQERATQRSRVEILRFALQQIRVLERGIAAAFRGSVHLAQSAVGGISAVTSRLAGIFRRSNRDLNDGLRGALLQRESSISRSFSKQSSIVTREMRQQSVTIERFQRQSQTGVAGALSGRSSVGAALGLGAGIGGGFAVFAGLKDSLKVGGDFVQGLAVLQAQLRLTDDEMAAVRAQSIELGNDISLPGVSALDAAQAIQILAKQFASLGEQALPNAQAAARGVLQLARATGASAEEAARVVGAAVNVFGVSADKAVQVADQVTNALTNAAGVGFSDFADAFQQSAAVFAQFQVPAVGAERAMTELNTALAILARSGNVGSDAGTSLKQFFLSTVRSSKPASEALTEITDRAGELGTVFFDQAGATRPLAEALDILRRGLKGLSDQDRNKSLNAIFGSDAIRTANALINVSGEEFAKLEAAMAATGTAAEIAAAQNVGLRGALDALGSVIETQQIKTYEKFQGVLGKVVLKFADLLNAFFEGRGIFGVIRAGLAGLIVVLGGLLVVKAVAEGFQFFAITLGALTTPLGLVITGLALLGTAIGVLSKVSPEFRSELGALGNSLKDRFLGVVSDVADGLAIVARFLRTEILPRFVEFGLRAISLVVPALQKVGQGFEYAHRFASAFFDAVRGGGVTQGGIFGFAEKLGTAARDIGLATKGFIDSVRGEGGTSFASRAASLTDQGRLILFAENLGTKFRELGLIIADFFGRLAQFVRPAINELKDLASAISEVGSGSILDGLKSALTSISPAQIATALGGAAIGAAIGGPIGAAIGGAIGLGLGDRIIANLLPQLQQLVGFVGGFLSSRVGPFSKSVESFLLGPFQTAAKRLGFFLGNLITDPRLVQAIEKLLALAALTGINFATAFVRGAISNLPRLMSDFVGQIDDLFNKGLREAFNDPTTFAKIIAAALISTSVIRAFRGAGESGAKGMIGGFTSGLRTNVAQAPNFLSGFFGGRAAIEAQGVGVAKQFQTALNREFAKGNRDLTRLGVAPVNVQNDLGLVTAEDVARQRQRIDIIKTKIGEMGSAGIIARQRLREGFRGIADDFTDLSTQMGSKGRAIGTTLGTGIVSGVGAMLAGQQLGGASSAGGAAVGLAGIIGAALIPAFSIPGPIGLGLAGLTLAIGGISAAIRLTGDDADDAAPRIQRYVDILRQVDGADETAAALAAQVADTLIARGNAVQTVLAQSGFNVRGFVDQAIDGQASLAGAVRELSGGLGVDQRRVEDFIRAEQATGDAATNTKDAIDALDKASRGRTTTTQATALIAEIKAAGGDAQAFVDIIEELFNAGGEIPTAINTAGVREDLLRTTAAAEGADVAFRQAASGLAVFTTPIEGATTGGQSVFFDNIRVNAERASAAMTAAFDAVQVGIDSLNQARTEGINTQIAAVTTELQKARDAATQALDNIKDLLGGNFETPLTQAFDQFVSSLPGSVEQMQSAIANGLDLTDALTVGGKEAREAFGPAITALQGLVTTALSSPDGPKTKAELTKFFDEIVRPAVSNFRIPIEVTNPDTGEVSVNQVALPKEVQGFLNEQIQGFLDDAALTTQLDSFEVSSTTATALQDTLDDLQMKLKLDVTFDPFQIAAELRKLQAAGVFTGVVPTNEQIAQAQSNAVAAATAAGQNTAIPSGPIPQPVVNIDAPITVTGAPTPIATAAETARALRVAAGTGFISRLTGAQ